MRLLRFVPIKLTLLLVLGILLGSWLGVKIVLSSVLVLIFTILLATVFLKETNRKGIAFGIIMAALTVALGILSIALSNPYNYSTHYSKQESNKGNWHLKITEVLKPTSFSRRYFAKVVSLNGKQVSGRLLLSKSLDSSKQTLQVDEEILLYASVEKIYPPLNPHQFNYKKYMNGLGYHDQISLNENNFQVLPDFKRTVYGLAASYRNKIITELEKTDFGKEELSIIKALLLGERGDIPKETYEDYKNAGAVHILAVSGLHIGILLLLLQYVLRPLEMLPHGKKIKLAVTVTLLWGFAFLAGFSASVIRAVTMFSFVAYALYLNRPSNTFNILALSMFFILLVIDSNLLFQVGFQMSYAAVFAIVWIYPLLQKIGSPRNRILKKIWQLLLVSVAAQLGVLPIGLFYFHQFPGLFFISNLVIVPALGLILGLGILVTLLALLNILPEILVTLYNSMIQLMNSIISWVAAQEAFIFKNVSFDGIQLVLAYVILISFVLFMNKSNFRRAVILGLAIIGFQAYLLFAEFRSGQKENLYVLHQSGNSVILQQSGKNMGLFTNDSVRGRLLADNFKVAERMKSISFRCLENSYKALGKDIYIMDSLAIYPPETGSIDYLLLTQSPKINLERLVDSLNPKNVIADGSNYKSYIERWKNTCAKKKIPFHYTGEKGSYKFR